MSAAPSASPRRPNIIDPAALAAGLRATRMAGNIHHFPEVASTNDLALAAAQAGTEHGVWLADAQTAGRGRGGHAWHSAPGAGLYVSALFTPRLPASALRLSLVAGLAAWEAIRAASGITADIRWPNDLVTRSSNASSAPARKLGGILVETAVHPPRSATEPAMLRYAVIGIGINVAQTAFPSGLSTEATSLLLEGWSAPDRQPLVLALLRQLDRHIHDLEEQYGHHGPAASHPDSLALLATASTWLHGKRVHVPEDGGYTGITAGLDPQGFLRVSADDGTTRTVRSGGVRELL